jgi:hypothetical protein
MGLDVFPGNGFASHKFEKHLIFLGTPHSFFPFVASRQEIFSGKFKSWRCWGWWDGTPDIGFRMNVGLSLGRRDVKGAGAREGEAVIVGKSRWHEEIVKGVHDELIIWEAKKLFADKAVNLYCIKSQILAVAFSGHALLALAVALLTQPKMLSTT